MKIFLASEPVNPSELPVKEENIIKSLGVPFDKADDYLRNLIREQIEYCKAVCTPCAGISVSDDLQFRKESATLIADGVSFNVGKMILPVISRSESLAFFVGTCGEKTGQQSQKLMKEGHALEGLIVDLIGSELAEGVADYIHKRLENSMAAMSLKTTNRYSPGYCNWPVSDQQKLFGLIGKNNCSIRLTDSSLMIPEKSVSGIIGMGSEVANRGYSCKWCDVDHCLYRDKKIN